MHFDANILRSSGLHFFWAATLTLDPSLFCTAPPPAKHNAPALTLRRFRDICVGFCAGVLLWCLCNCNWCWLFDSLNVETNRWATRTENENWNWNRNWNWAPVEQLTAVGGGVLHKPRTGERWQLWLVVWQFCDLNSIMTCKKLAGGLPTREILLLQMK